VAVRKCVDLGAADDRVLGLGLGHKAPTATTTRAAPPRDGLVTIADIAKDVGVSPNKARSILRSHGVPRPEAGWAWSASEVARVKAMLAAPSTTLLASLPERRVLN
jgi:hypothetical protein